MFSLKSLWIALLFSALLFSVSSAAVNHITITEKSGSAITNHPIQIGVPFVEGDIPAFPEVLLNGTPVTTQADVKTRHADGSVKHAIISFIIPALTANNSTTVTFRNQTTGNNTGYLTKTGMLASEFNFDATMDITLGTVKTVSARTMLTDSSYQYWLKGSVATSIILTDHSLLRKYDIGTDTNKSVRPIFHATFWPSLNKVYIRFIGENANSDRFQDQNCSVSMQAGLTSPITVYTQNSFTFTAGSRWTKTAWIGGAPSNVDIRFNLAYLAATRAIPNYDTTKVVSSAAVTGMYNNWQSTAKAFYDEAFWTKYMGATGGRADIGPYPRWVIQWFYTGDNRMLEISAGLADIAAAWPMHVRECNPTKKLLRDDTLSGLGRVLSISNRPSIAIENGPGYSWTAAADRIKTVGPFTSGGWDPDDAHQPDPFSVLYTLTGEYWYLEEMLFWASWTAAYYNGAATSNNGGRGPTGAEGGIAPVQLRGQAWCLRSRAQAAYFTPDSMPEKRYFNQLLLDAAAAWEGEHNITTTAFNGNTQWTWGKNYYGSTLGVPALNQWSAGGSGFVQEPLNPAICASGISTWEQNFMMYALGRATELGFPFKALLSYLSVNIIGQATALGYNHYLMAAYRLPTVRLSDNRYFDSWTTLQTGYLASAQTVSAFEKQDGDHGYDFIALTASSMAANEPGGDSAWAFLKRELLATPLLNDNPKWAITPRPVPPSLAEAPKTNSLESSVEVYPNPFNPSLTFSVLTQKQHLQIAIFDASGRMVRMLTNEKSPERLERISWNGQDSRGLAVTTGVYFAKIKTGNKIQTVKLVYLK